MLLPASCGCGGAIRQIPGKVTEFESINSINPKWVHVFNPTCFLHADLSRGSENSLLFYSSDGHRLIESVLQSFWVSTRVVSGTALLESSYSVSGRRRFPVVFSGPLGYWVA